MTDVWEKFIELRRKNGSEQEVAFLKHSYVRSNNVVKIQIHNSILEKTYDKLRVELLSYLRTNLQNDSIQIELEQLESESKKMLYTNKEKFEHIVRLYPVVKQLQEKLSLDPDY